MTDHDERNIRDAFDRLREDTGKVDTMRALHSVQGDSGSMFRRVGVLAAAAVVVIAVIVGGVVLSSRDDGSTVIADDPDGDESPTDDTAPDADGDLEATLQGSAWVLVEGVGPDGPIPLVDGWPITMSFEGENVGGRAACNGYDGTYSIDGTSLSIGELLWEQMGCDGDVGASEAAFLTALPSVDTIGVVNGQLRLSGEGVDLLFERETPVPTAELIGTVWLLDTLIQGEAASSVQGDPATLLLDADGNVSGGTGCRSFTGSYIINGGSVLFPSFGMEGECPAQLASQDNIVVTVLGDGFSAEVDGDRLTLSSVGNEGLGYRRFVPGEDEECVSPDCVDSADRDILTDLNQLLDEPPEGEVDVSAYLVDTGGGWYLCEQIDTSLFTRCSGRWVPVVHLDQQIISQFGPNELSDDIGSWRQSEEPVLLGGRILEDGRFAVAASSVPSEPSAEDVELASRFLELDVSQPDVDSLPLSPDGVVMGLGNAAMRTHTIAELADPANWSFESNEFRGRTGTFSALDVLANADDTEIIVGTHNHCASPPAAVPEELRDARRLSVQPTGIDSCLLWWTVDLFLDDGGNVVGIVFDTWEP